MSGESEEETQPSLNCLMCDVAIASDSSYSIYYTVIPHSGTLLMNAVQKVIRKSLDQYVMSSSFLCTKCFSLFEQLDSAEEKSRDLRQTILRGFSANPKSNGFEAGHVPGVGCQTDKQSDASDSDAPSEEVSEKKRLRGARNLRRYVHPCTVCGRLFRRPCELKQHMFSHGVGKRFKCGECAARFSTKSGAAVHALKKHGPSVMDPKIEEDHKEEVEAEETGSEESEECEVKDEEPDWPEESDGYESNPEEVRVKCEEAEVKPTRGRVKKRAGKKEEGGERVNPRARPKRVLGEPLRLDCSICGKQWRTRSELKAHVATHSTERPFICEICGQAYKHKPALDVHVGMHQGINPFCCPFCKKSFTQKGALQRHLPIHTGEAPFQCELCGKRFVHHTSFNMHTLAHTGEKSYKCSVCGLALLSASHLKRHTRVHTGERPYQCPTCGKRFAERYNLAAHQRIHQHSASKLHSCQLCGAGFDRKPKLEDHLASCHNKISDDRSLAHVKTLDDSRKWVGHPQQMPGEMHHAAQQTWHHMIFDPAKIQEANTHSSLLPSRVTY